MELEGGLENEVYALPLSVEKACLWKRDRVTWTMEPAIC